MLADLFIRLRALFRRRAVESELEDELQFHRERQLDAYARAGVPPDEARRRFAIEFGGLEQAREACRDARGISAIEHFRRDVRYGLRSLLRTPGFTVVAVLTLGLGLGATTAIFSVVYGVLLRPLPFADPSALVVMHETTPKVGLVSVSYPNFLDWRTQSRLFSSMSAVCDLEVSLGGIARPELLSAEAVSSNYLALLGVAPILGRDFTGEEDRAGTARVVLLGYPLWQARFGGDPAALGRTITLDGRPATIVGVLPRGFRTLDRTDLLEPIGMWLTETGAAGLRGSRGDTVVVGRLAPGARLAQARTEMEGIAGRLARAYPAANADFGVSLQPMREVFVGNLRPALLVLFAAVVCVLLIACANVANLSLIRGAGRTREIALRVAMGAGPRRIVQQLLVESGLLALLGGLVGLALAFGGVRGLAWLVPDGTFGDAPVVVNGVVLAFAAAAVLASTIVLGVAPARHAARPDLTTDLKEGGRSASPGRRHQRWRGLLAAAEVALALVLLVGAGLMMRSLSRLLAVEPGISTDRVLTMYFDLRSARYDDRGAKQAFWQEILERSRRLPGVESAALGTGVPLTNDHSRRDISIEGEDYPAGALPHPDVHIITPEYTETLGIRVLRGRAFSAADGPRALRVGLINRSIAEHHFAGIDPIGRRFTFGRPGESPAVSWVTIVGVVEDTRLYGLDNPSRLEVYLPLAQAAPGGMTLLLKSSLDPESLVPSVRAAAASIDPDQPLAGVASMDELLDQSVSTRRTTFMLLSLFSGLALALAAIGIYGVMSYAVAQRTNELGIRLALGASRRDVLRTVIGQGLSIAVAGIVAGVAAALVVTRLLRTLLFAVSPVDLATFAAVAATMALVAVAACVVPGWRAIRVDPQVALRHQ